METFRKYHTIDIFQFSIKLNFFHCHKLLRGSWWAGMLLDNDLVEWKENDVVGKTIELHNSVIVCIVFETNMKTV